MSEIKMTTFQYSPSEDPSQGIQQQTTMFTRQFKRFYGRMGKSVKSGTMRKAVVEAGGQSFHLDLEEDREMQSFLYEL